MIKLLAVAREDGFAFAREGDAIYFLRPPYSSEARFAEVSEATVARAVTEHGFAPMDQAFEHWSELMDYLRREIVEAGRERGLKEPEEGLDVALLRHALPEMIDAMLEEIERDLVPNGAFVPAERLLVAILRECPCIREDAALHARTFALLSRSIDARDKAEGARQRTLDLVAREAERRRFHALHQQNRPGLEKARNLRRRFSRAQRICGTG